MVSFSVMRGYNGQIAVKAETVCPILPNAKETCRNPPPSDRVPAPGALAAEGHEKLFAKLPG
jgi:hypothetical protein